METTVRHRRVLGFVWRQTEGNRLQILGIFTLMMSVTALSLAQPLFFKQAIDAISQSDRNDMEAFRFARMMFLTGTACVGMAILLEQWAMWTLGKLEASVMAKAYSEGMAKIQHLSTDFHVNAFAGSTARKVSRGADSLETILDRIIQNFLPAVTVTIGFLIVLWWYAPIIALLVVAGIVVYAAFSIASNVFMMRYYRKVEAQDSLVMGNMVDVISANTVVKSFAKEKGEEKHHNGLVTEWRRRLLRVWRMSTMFTSIQSVILIALEVGILLLSLRMWQLGLFTTGSFIVMIVYIWQLWSKLWDIGRNVRHYLQATSRCAELVELIEKSHVLHDVPHARKLNVSKGKVSFENVLFGYESQGKAIFRNFSLTIKPGETVALVGHSGGGKSTLVKLLLRLYDVQRGSIDIDGQNIAHVTQESLRRSIGLVPQEPILFHRTIAENISYGKSSATEAEIARAAKLSHAHEFIKNLPKGYDTLVGERGVKLSGGERQRVALARAILADAPLLILDEATSSLDSVSERYIQDALNYLMKDRTTIVIAHRLSTIKRADRIIVLKKGTIVEQGSHVELLKIPKGIYRHLYELQAGGFIGE